VAGFIFLPPGIKVKAIKSLGMRAILNEREVWPDFFIETVFIHPEIIGSVTNSDDSRLCG
jgi:hypothetical protein